PEAEDLRRHVTLLAAHGVPHTLFSGDEIRGVEPALAPLAAALLTPDHGYVGVATLMAALAEAAGRRGVSFVTSRVQAVSAAPGGVRIDTLAEAIDADAVVIAAGSWSGTIPVAPAAPPPVQPIRGQ